MNLSEVDHSNHFLKAILDSLTEHIVVIDRIGTILFVNQSWNNFAQANACGVTGPWYGVNYLDACDKAAALSDDFGRKAAKGIRGVISSGSPDFYLEYPCHSPHQRRWFMMRVTPFVLMGEPSFVISHQNITERKLAEQAIIRLSRIDSLTDIYNRKYFEEILDKEIRRTSRVRGKLSFGILDVDHFKQLNDTYGHLAGDECLQKIAMILKSYTKRASDSCARYGGDEFVFVFGRADLPQAEKLAECIQADIRELQIPNRNAETHSFVTTSAGLVTIAPANQTRFKDIISCADQQLYKAKQQGRDRLVSEFVTVPAPRSL